jgi:ABC-type lipoprotein release transport system permease subunit
MWGEQLRMAWQSLRANTFRSLLTMLGIIIGSSTLVSVLSLGNALQGQVFERFIDLGTRRVAILPGDPDANGARVSSGYGLLSIKDFNALDKIMRGQVHHIGNVLLLCVVHAGGPWSAGGADDQGRPNPGSIRRVPCPG